MAATAGGVDSDGDGVSDSVLKSAQNANRVQRISLELRFE